MSLVSCPDCQHDVSDAAPTCIHCGRPLAPQSPTEPGPQYEFFPVATHKFVVLSLVTLNFYTLYWCFCNWQRIRARTGDRLSAFWRAFFAPIWVFSLFPRIREEARGRQVAVAWSPAFLGVAYLVVSCTSMVPDPWWLVSIAGFVPFVPVVRTIERVNEQRLASESRNDSYSGANVATIIFGGLILVLAVAGTFMTEEELETAPETTGWSPAWQTSAQVPPIGSTGPVRHWFA